jgi:hypothetical protein
MELVPGIFALAGMRLHSGVGVALISNRERRLIMNPDLLKTVSENYLNGSIRQLEASGDWPERLWELRSEIARRNSKRRKSA